jgi:Spy/CpxP family protein refolding chaperone
MSPGPQLSPEIQLRRLAMKIEKMLGGLVSLGLAAALAVPGAFAKPQTAPQTAGKEMGMHGGGLEAAVQSLNLTDDQKAKVKDIFADAKTKKQAVSSDASLSEEQKKAKMKELHSGIMAKLNEVLTPDQQTELKNKMEAAKTKAPMHP